MVAMRLEVLSAGVILVLYLDKVDKGGEDVCFVLK